MPVPGYNAVVSSQPAQHMQCMEVWGGSQLTSAGVEMGGLDVWVYSKPFGEAQRGGDVYYASSCATGRISRLLLADVSGHGTSVAATAADSANSDAPVRQSPGPGRICAPAQPAVHRAFPVGDFRYGGRDHILCSQPAAHRLQRGASQAVSLPCGPATMGFSGSRFSGPMRRIDQEVQTAKHPPGAAGSGGVRATRRRTGARRLPPELHRCPGRIERCRRRNAGRERACFGSCV